MSTPGDPRTAQTSHSQNLMMYPDGIRQGGFVIRRITGAINVFVRHPNVTWTRVGTTLTCTWVDHEFVNGEAVLVRDCSSAQALDSNVYHTIFGVSGDTFQITGYNAGDASGWFCGYQVEDASAIANVRTGLALLINPNQPAYPAGDGSAIPGNTVYGIDNTDLHNVLGMGIDELGRFWLAGQGHADNIRVVRSAANSIKTWTAPYSGGGTSYPFYYASGVPPTPATTGANYHTYHHFHRLPNERLLWFTDQQEGPGSTGRDYLMAQLAAGGANWAPVLPTWIFAESELINNTQFGSQDVYANRVYVTGVTIHEDKIHAQLTWRIWNTLEVGAKHASYVWAYISDLTTWYNIHGDEMVMPLGTGNTAAARDALGHYFYEADLTHYVSGSGQGIGIDEDGFPHMMLTIAEHDSLGNTFNHTPYRDHYWDGSAWQIATLTAPGGANGPTYFNLGNDLIMLTEGPRSPKPRSARIVSRNLSTIIAYAGATTSTYSPMADPVKRYNDDVLSFQVSDGDDPWVYEIGGHRRADAAYMMTSGVKTADGSEETDLSVGSLVWADWTIHVPTFTGFTDVTVTIEDSNDGVTWNLRHTEVITATGDIRIPISISTRYQRVAWDVNGAGSIDLNVFMKRR